MRILILSAGFFPGKKCGGPPVSVDNFCSLMKEHECFIVATDHDMGSSQRYSEISDGWNDRKNARVLYLSDSKFRSKMELDRIISDIKPDWIYFQSLFQSCVLPGLLVAKKYGINVMLAPRGEICAGAFKKKYKKIPYIWVLKRLNLLNGVHFQSTSEEEKQAIHTILEVPLDDIYELTNIPSIPKMEYKHRKKRPGYARMVFISRIHPKKNLLFALRCLMLADGEVDFDIYGPKEDLNYWKQCEEVIQNFPESINVNYCGLIDHELVHETFSKYDAFFFPTLSENFGHVIAESLMVNTPVIISDQTPWTDVMSNGAGWAIELDDMNQFVVAINELIHMDEKQTEVMRESIVDYVKNKLDLVELQKQYNQAFLVKSVVNN